MIRAIAFALLAVLGQLVVPSPAAAAPGDLLSTVNLPGNGGCSVAGTLAVTSFGTHYITLNTNACFGTQIGVYSPCVGNPCDAAVVATKPIIRSDNGLTIRMGALAWDPTRTTATSVKVWGVSPGFGMAPFTSFYIWLIDLGDPTTGAQAIAQPQCRVDLPGFHWSLTDGLAYDASDDTLYMSPDVDQSVYWVSLGTNGNGEVCTLLDTISPQDANGVEDGRVSGVAIGAGQTLYIGRDGAAEIRQVNNPSGTFISQFATTAGRVESLSCDPVTHAPKEAILSKDAYRALYEAFEVEAGTCPLPVACEDPAPRTQGFWRAVCNLEEHPEQPDRSFLTAELCEDLNPDPHSDPCERARSQLAALLYNIESGRVAEGCIDNNTGNDVGATVAAAQALIEEGTHDSCKTAAALAVSINEGNVSVP